MKIFDIIIDETVPTCMAVMLSLKSSDGASNSQGVSLDDVIDLETLYFHIATWPLFVPAARIPCWWNIEIAYEKLSNSYNYLKRWFYRGWRTVNKCKNTLLKIIFNCIQCKLVWEYFNWYNALLNLWLLYIW